MDFKQTGPQAASNLIGWGLTSRDIVEVGTRLGRDPIIPEIVEPSVRVRLSSIALELFAKRQRYYISIGLRIVTEAMD